MCEYMSMLVSKKTPHVVLWLPNEDGHSDLYFFLRIPYRKQSAFYDVEFMPGRTRNLRSWRLEADKCCTEDKGPLREAVVAAAQLRLQADKKSTQVRIDTPQRKSITVRFGTYLFLWNTKDRHLLAKQGSKTIFNGTYC